MPQQEYYSELYKHISKEMLANMFKTQKRAGFVEPLVNFYSNQLDNVNTFAKLQDYSSKQM